jgi:hypothetical protein
MSWSTFAFRGHWAHAHDAEQNAFMALAAIYVDVDRTCRDVDWLRDWRSFWLESVGNQGNGCSDLGAEEFLTDDGRVADFRQFLRRYRSWIESVRPALAEVVAVPTDRLIAFATTVDAVLAGDGTHPRVRVTT